MRKPYEENIVLLFSKCLNSAGSDSKTPRTKKCYDVGFPHQGSWQRFPRLKSGSATMVSIWSMQPRKEQLCRFGQSYCLFPVECECYRAKIFANPLRASTSVRFQLILSYYKYYFINILLLAPSNIIYILNKKDMFIIKSSYYLASLSLNIYVHSATSWKRTNPSISLINYSKIGFKDNLY